MIRWLTTDKDESIKKYYMDVVEARKFFMKYKKPEFEIPGSRKNYYPHNYERHLLSLEK